MSEIVWIVSLLSCLFGLLLFAFSNSFGMFVVGYMLITSISCFIVILLLNKKQLGAEDEKTK